MSDSRDTARLEEIGKENRKRQQSSEQCRGGSSSWQITSISRCLACGRLGTMCDCDKTKMDPQLKRQRLDTFLLNTPYVRCKQMKALDDFGREESRQRRRLMDKWGEEWEKVAHLAFTQQRLFLLAREETAGREALMACERKEWAERMSAVNRHVVVLAIALHEREERLRLCALAQREGQALMAWNGTVFQLLGLQSREDAFRAALVNHEAAARAALQGRNVEMLNMMDVYEKERYSVYEAAWERRGQLLAEWLSDTEMIQSAISSDLRRIEWIILERKRLDELCVWQKKGLEAEEKEERQCLGEYITEQGRFMMERARVCKQQQDALVQEEATARDVIVQDEMSIFSTFWSEFKQNEKAVRDVEQLKYRQRETEVSEAIRHLQSIVNEEETAFVALKTQERREKEQRYQWMLEKEKQCCEMEQCAFNQMQLVWNEEVVVRQGLMKAMREAEVGIAAWVQQKTRTRREIVEMAMGQKAEIRIQEHEERFSLVSHKAEHEDAVRRWIDQKEAVRQSAMKEEAMARANGVEMERAAREELTWQLAAGLDVCRAIALERIDKQEKFQQKALQFLKDIVEQEAKELLLLCRAAQDDKERARHEENQRQLLGVLNAETECRTHILQQEVRHRESIFTQLQLHRSLVAKEAQELFKACICEVLAAEESQRHLLLHNLWEATQHLSLEFRQSCEEAKTREAARVRSELRQREVALLEDARVYDENEMLTFDTHDGMSEPHSPKEDPPVSETWCVQRQFVCAELGASEKDVALLTPASVVFLANVMSVVSNRESLVAARLAQAEAALKEARRKVTSQRQLLAAAKERWEESKEKLDRDAAEHNARMSMRRNARQKDDAQLERARERLSEKTEELRKMRDSVSGMREAIHSKYQKR